MLDVRRVPAIVANAVTPRRLGLHLERLIPYQPGEDTTGVANPLTGLVFCADCGAKMYNHRKKSFSEKEGRGIDPITGLYPYDSYECSTYSLTFNRRQKECGSHYIRTRDLRTLLLDTIRAVNTYAISNEAKFIEKVRAASEIRQTQAAKDLKRKLSKDRKRSKELDGLIKKLYEAYAGEKISEKRFEVLSGEYEQEQEMLEATIKVYAGIIRMSFFG